MKETFAEAGKRITYAEVKQFEVEAYDADNLYPHRIDDLVKASPTTGACVETYAKFIRGDGFTDKTFYQSPVNFDGLTCDKLLRRLTDDYSEYRGFAIQINYNALYEIVELNYVPFEHVRIGIEKKKGLYCVYPDWSRYKNKPIENKNLEWYNPFNPEPEVIQEQVDFAGGWEEYKGQLLYYSADYEGYPLASCDKVLESCLSETYSDRTTSNNLRTNFSAKKVYFRKSQFEDDNERNDFKENLKNFIGPDGSSFMLVEAESEEEAPELVDVDSKVNDKLFEYTDNKVTRKIIRNYKVPAILLSITDGGYFNQQQLQDATNFYNLMTSDERILMEETFSKLGKLFHENINASGDYSISPINFGRTYGTDTSDNDK